MTQPPREPPPAMLPVKIRELLGLDDKCPGCGESFGITRDWADLIAKVDAHLNQTGCRGAG